jgi:kynurenine formamidase
MSVRLIDLNVPTEDSVSEPLKIKVVHQKHEDTAAAAAGFWGAKPEDLPEGMGWANDLVELYTHSGTHLDAPWHFYPTSEGKRAITIDEVPLEWCYGDGVVLDFRSKPNGSAISLDDLQTELQRINYSIKPLDIVMIMTGADKLWGKEEYFHAGCGMSAEATLWLCNQGVKVMGIDAWGWDRPFWAIREEFAKTGDARILWEAHRVGIEKEYCHIEKLANLEQIPKPYGFKVSCFPVKLTGGSAGWCRVVAIIEE